MLETNMSNRLLFNLYLWLEEEDEFRIMIVLGEIRSTLERQAIYTKSGKTQKCYFFFEERMASFVYAYLFKFCFEILVI